MPDTEMHCTVQIYSMNDLPAEVIESLPQLRRYIDDEFYKPFAIGIEFQTMEDAAAFSSAHGIPYDSEDEECVWFGFYDTREEAEFVRNEMIVRGSGKPEAKRHCRS